MRLNKFLAHEGYTTRRGADALIESGKVFVNGKKAVVGEKVTEGDRVEVRGHDAPRYRYLLYYKPRGVITHSPGEGEVDIAAQVKRDHKITGLFPVGRLDKDSEGLIILTNDGRITGRILSPEREHEREYEVSVDKRVTETFLNGLRRGVNIEGYRTKPAHAEPLGENSFRITLTEGKKHQVRRMCAAMGFQVTRLKRTRMLNFEIRNLTPGNYHELTGKEVSALRGRLGLPE